MIKSLEEMFLFFFIFCPAEYSTGVIIGFQSAVTFFVTEFYFKIYALQFNVMESNISKENNHLT